MTIQSISFYKPRWNLDSSMMYLSKHDMQPIKEAHETAKMIHYRLQPPSDFKFFKNEKYSKEGVMLTIGHNEVKKVKGDLQNAVSLDENLDIVQADGRFVEPSPLQEVFPLSKEADILNKQIVGNEEVTRLANRDKITQDDKTEVLIKKEESVRINGHDFLPGSMIYEMMRPRASGGMGFPFPTSSSIFSPGAPW